MLEALLVWNEVPILMMEVEDGRMMPEAAIKQRKDEVARVQELVNTDPSKSMRAMARELEVFVTLVCKIVKDLRYKSYGLRKGQFMLKGTKLRQLEKAKKLKSCLKHPQTRRFGPLAVQTATPST